MVDTKAKDPAVGLLLQDRVPFSYGTSPHKKGCNKSRVRRIAEPHLEPRRVHGRVYWYYRRGVDPPVYLGTADAILKAVNDSRAGSTERLR